MADMSWTDDFKNQSLNDRQRELINVHDKTFRDRANTKAESLGLGYPGVVDLPNGDRMYLYRSGSEGFRYVSPSTGRGHDVKVGKERMAEANNRAKAAEAQTMRSNDPGELAQLFDSAGGPDKTGRYLQNPFDIMAAKADSLRNPEQADRYNQAVKNTQFANEAFRQQREAFLRGEGPEPTFRPSMQDAQDQLKNDQGFYAPNEGAAARPTPAPPGYVMPGGGYENPFADYGGYPGREPPSGPPPAWDQIPIGDPGFGNPSGPIDGSPAPGGPNAPGNLPPTGQPGGGGDPFAPPGGGGGQPPVDWGVPVESAPPPKTLTTVNQWFGSKYNPESGEFETGGGNPTNEEFYSRQFNRLQGQKDQMRDRENQARKQWNIWQREQARKASQPIDWGQGGGTTPPPQSGLPDAGTGLPEYVLREGLSKGMTNSDILDMARSAGIYDDKQLELLTQHGQGNDRFLGSKQWGAYGSRDDALGSISPEASPDWGGTLRKTFNWMWADPNSIPGGSTPGTGAPPGYAPPVAGV